MTIKQETYLDKIAHHRLMLAIEIVLTLLIGVVAAFVVVNNVERNAQQTVTEASSDYAMVMTEYTRCFDIAYDQISAKLDEQPSFDELDAWLKSKEQTWTQAMGESIYDGIGIAYQGGYAHSWSNGDYTNYDATTRDWYKTAMAAGGTTKIVPPYVTFLNSQVNAGGDRYVLMSIVRAYSDTVAVDYDIKTVEIEDLLATQKSVYVGTKMMMYDPEGNILSSDSRDQLAHNVFEADDVISSSVVDALAKSSSSTDKLLYEPVDGQADYILTSKDGLGNSYVVFIPVLAVWTHDIFPVAILILVFICFEIVMYRRDRLSLLEFKHRDDRISALANAAFQERMYIDRETMTFYGNDKAAARCPSGSYRELYGVMRSWIDAPEEVADTDKVFSPEMLMDPSRDYRNFITRRVPIRWPNEDGNGFTHCVMEINRLDEHVDGRDVVGIVARDVTESAAVLKDALRQAESAAHAKGVFLSSMSHEIRTPLNAIIGYLDIAQSDPADQDNVVHCLDQLRIASRHLLDIINDILDVSSIESGRMKIANDDFDLPQMINSLTTIFYAQAQDKGVAFDVQVVHLTEEWVRGDSMRVNQILLNLLSNAVKFTPAGGSVTLTIKQEGIRDGHVMFAFTVTDTGIGMSKEYLNRMFKPFEQESASTARTYGGTGLGLSIAHNLTNMMGGTIEVTSEQGVGTSFCVRLPFGQAAEQSHVNATTDTFSNLRALVVDDDVESCEYVKRLLTRCGVRCDTVTSGKKALRRVRSHLNDYPYDLCIVDWNMPDMDGMETSRQIHEACGDDVPIIIATAYDYSDIVDEAKDAGVSKIISKPLFQSTLFDTLVNTYGTYLPSQQGMRATQDDVAGLTVLLAEDNSMNMEIACSLLGKAGINIIKASDGKEALDTFLASSPSQIDAILMDVQMPVMDGYQATRAIRVSDHPNAETIPIIAMTANAFTSDVTEAITAGMNEHVAKPIDFEHLFDVLAQLTGRKGNE